MFERDDLDRTLVLIDPVDDAVAAAACAVQSGEFLPEALADAMRAGRQRAVDKLDRRGGRLLRQVPQRALGR